MFFQVAGGPADAMPEVMMSLDAALQTFRLQPGTPLAQADPSNNTPVTLDSPALDVMTDLTLVKAATTHPATGLRQAEQTMIYQGVRMLFVVTEMPSIEGLITSSDLRGDRPMRLVQERGLRHDDLCVADVMTELAALDAVELRQVTMGSVGNIVATLRRLGRFHLLVLEDATAQSRRRVRGIISLAQVERQLGRALDVTPIASSFAEIERVLA